MDANFIIHTFENIDIPTLLVIGGMLWIFKSHLDKKFEKIDQRFEKIELRLNEIDRRLVAVETTLRIQGACALKEGRVLEKAE